MFDVFNIVNITNEHNTTHKNVMFHTKTHQNLINIWNDTYVEKIEQYSRTSQIL
jgi:hypothetical protein